jgi:ribosomal protein S18 acetylase RimI-like enzyme
MDTIQIRRGIASDAPALTAFATRTFAEAFGADNRPEDMQAHLASSYNVPQQTKELIDPNIATLLALQGETLWAYAQVRRQAPPACVTQERPIELHRFYVDRRLHGQGVAQQLMVAVHEAAHAFHAQHVWLSVWERNQRGIAFYKKEGFLDVGRKDFYVGPDCQSDRVLVAAVRPIHTDVT